MLAIVKCDTAQCCGARQLQRTIDRPTRDSTCYAQFGAAGCWGDNDFGLLGRNDDLSRLTLASDAIPINFGTTFVVNDIYGGYQHLCAVSEVK